MTALRARGATPAVEIVAAAGGRRRSIRLTKALVRRALPLHDSVADHPGSARLHARAEYRRGVRLPQRRDFPVQDVVHRDRRDDGADRRRRFTRPASAHDQLARAHRAGAHHRRRGRQPASIASVIGSVVDFVDVYWRTCHFWAFNVADSAITVGVALMILDMLWTRHACIQDCLSSARVTVYTYGVLLAAAYLLGLQLAMAPRARRAASTRRGSSTSASTSSSRAGRREAAAADHRLPIVRQQPARAADARAIGRRVLRRLDPRGRGRAVVHPPRQPAALDDVRCVCAGHCAGPRRRTLRLFLRRLLLRQADHRAVGDHVHRSVRRAPTSARRSTSRCIRRSSTKRAPKR